MVDLTRSLPKTRRVTVARHTLMLWGGLALILFINVWSNWYWISRNVSPYGRDAGGHMTRALQYAEVLNPLTWQSLFQAVTFHGFRPPALYLAAQVPYALFGHSMDAVQLTNVFFLVVILCLVFAIARRMADERVALVATAITGLFPMMAAMSRTFYLDNFLTASVLLILFALLASEGFARRRWAIGWGLAVGLGMLVKWSLPAHIILPSLFLIGRAGLPRAQWEALRRPRVDGRALAVATGAALLVAGLWYLPNRAHALTLPLGDWLFGVWVALLVPAFYALRRPSRPLTNFWAGTFFGLALASLWYAARIDFLGPLVNTAVGDYGGRYEGSFNPWTINNWLRYPRYMITDQLGLLGGLVLLPLGLAPWIARGRSWRRARLGAWLLWLTVLGTYLALGMTWENGKRNLVPLLPLLAIVLADSLFRYRRGWRWAIGGAWALALVMHWAVFTFDGMEATYQRTAALWADAEFLQRPASGTTDPGFWIAPDVLDTLQASHNPLYGPKTILGMLINAPEIHRGPYNYLIRTDYPELDLIELTEREPDMWIRTARSEWVLSKTGDNHELDPAGLRALAEVYEKPKGLFPLLFDPVRRYPLPNGDVATLWRREVGPPYLPTVDESLAPLGELLAAWLTDQPLLLSEPEQALDLALLDLTPSNVALSTSARPTAPTLFLLRHAGEVANSALDERLQRDYYPAYDGWFGPHHLTIWGKPTSTLVEHQPARTVGDHRLATMATVARVAPGAVVPVDLAWEVGAAPAKLSLRLIDGTGNVVAQLDRDLAAAMRLALFVPPATAPGRYTLAATLYDPATLAPLADAAGETLFPLATVTVE